MSQKKGKKQAQAISSKEKITEPDHKSAGKPIKFSLTDFRFQCIILALFGFILYGNTFGNGSAFDDKVVINQNEYVQSGLSGIPHILTGESYESFSKQQRIGNPLTGGRYRPLSIVTFAIEQQFLGPNESIQTQKDEASIKAIQQKQENDMHLRHFVNTVLYILTTIVLLIFFRKIIFPGAPLLSLAGALLFLVHPVHTEVVANVKSRDEILSLLFILLTLIYAHEFTQREKYGDKIKAMVFFFLALLSKEYALVLVVLLPIFLFVTTTYAPRKIISSLLLFLVPLAIYLALRFSSVSATSAGADDEIMNNPYLFATMPQRYASIFAVLLRYLKILFWPAILSADYSYKQIPYSDFSDPAVWASIAIYAVMGIVAVILIMRRHITGLGFAIFLLFLVPVCNLFVNVGAPMGERFLFHSSVGLCIVLAWGLGQILTKISDDQKKQFLWAACIAPLVLLSAFKTTARNRDWASDATLFLHDVNTVPNSIIANCNAGAAWIDKADMTKDTALEKQCLRNGLPFLTKAISMHHKYVLAYINRGIIYYRLGSYENALSDCDTVNKYFPTNPALGYLSYSLSDHYFKLGLNAGRANDAAHAIENFRKGVEAAPHDADLWYNLGYAYYSDNQWLQAKKAFNMTLSFKPGHQQARNMLAKLQQEGH